MFTTRVEGWPGLWQLCRESNRFLCEGCDVGPEADASVFGMNREGKYYHSASGYGEREYLKA